MYVYSRLSASVGYAEDENGNVTISDEAGLFRFAKAVNNEGNTFNGKTVKLANDITLTKNWTAVGETVAKSFKGTFDGDGHKIIGMSVAGGSQKYGYGFFKNLISATVKNVTFEKADIAGAYSNVVGTVAGYSYGSSTFENVHVTNSSVYAFGKVGGMVGMAEDGGATTTFKNCSVTDTTLHGGYNMAGFLGLVMGNCNVSGSYLKDNTITVDENSDGFGNITILDTTVACDGSVSTCAGNGTAIKGRYLPKNGYYWSAYSDLYNHYGASSHDCTLADGKMLANSEVVHDAPVAIGDVKYSDLATAIAAAKDGDTVTLLANCSGDGIQVKGGKNITVDFANYSYTVGGKLVGSTGTASNGFQLLAGNTITMKNGFIYGDASVAGDDITEWSGAPAIMIQNYSNLTLDNMTVSGGKQTVYTISNNNGNTVIKDSIINAGNAEGTKYSPVAFDVCRYSSYPSVSVTVEGNSVINGNIEISGGIGEGQSRQLNIKNGTFNGKFSISGNVPANIAISGGKFAYEINPDYCADGFIPTKNADGTYGVKSGKYVAELNGVKYETLQAAIYAAGRSQTVTLVSDTRENVTIAKPLTLDLNGYTLNGGTESGKPALTVTARGVTVKDSSTAQTGTIMREDTAENSGISSYYVIDVQGVGWLTFEGGNVKNNSGIVGVKGASLVRIGDDSVAKYPGLNIKGGTFTQDNFIAIKVDRGDLFLNGGTINSANSYAIENWFRATVKGGTVNGDAASWTYSGGANSTLEIIGGTINGNVTSVNYGNAENKKATVRITGGTVNGELDTRSYDPTTGELTAIDDAKKAAIEVTGGTFTNDPTAYLVESSSITKENGKYSVAKAYLAKVGNTQYYTMDEAFKAQTASGEDIVLLRYYKTAGTFSSGSIKRTVNLNGYTWTYTGTGINDAAFEINYSDATLTVKNGKVISNSMIGLIPSAIGGTITYDNSTLIFENVEMISNGHSGFETNGNNTNDTVILKNSTLNVPNGFGIYFPSSGALTIENSKITAKTMGVQVCAGSLNISSNSEITVTGDPVAKTENDGAIQDGAAVSVVNRPGYRVSLMLQLPAAPLNLPKAKLLRLIPGRTKPKANSARAMLFPFRAVHSQALFLPATVLTDLFPGITATVHIP